MKTVQKILTHYVLILHQVKNSAISYQDKLLYKNFKAISENIWHILAWCDEKLMEMVNHKSSNMICDRTSWLGLLEIKDRTVNEFSNNAWTRNAYGGDEICCCMSVWKSLHFRVCCHLFCLCLCRPCPCLYCLCLYPCPSHLHICHRVDVAENHVCANCSADCPVDDRSCNRTSN